MPRQHKCLSVDSATSTVHGEVFESRGHNSVGLFVVARNLDPANDTVEVVLEASHTDESMSSYEHGAVRRPGAPGGSNVVGINASELSGRHGDGTYSGFAYAHGVPAEHFSAHITSFTDNANGDLEVDVWLYFGNWNGPGREFREVK